MPLPKSNKQPKHDDEIEITSPSIVSRSILQALINANNASSTPSSLPFTIPLTDQGMFSEDKAQRKLLLEASLLPAFTEGKARILQTMRLFARRIVNAHSMNHSVIHVDEPGYSSSLKIDIPRIQHDLKDLATRFSMLHAFLLKTCVDSAVFAVNQSAIQPRILGSSPLQVQRPKIRGVRRLKDKDKVMNESPVQRRADRSKAEREVFKPDAITVLVDWFKSHITSPYPSDDEKLTLCEQTGLTRAQLQAWFVNARGRRWKKLLAETKQEAASGQSPSPQQQPSKSPVSASSKQKHKIAVKSERDDDDATSSDSVGSDSEYEEKSTRNKGKRERRSKHHTRKRRRTTGSSQPASSEHDNSHDQTRTEQIVRTFTRRTSMNAGVLEQLRLMPGLEPAESIGSVSSSYSSVNHSIDRTLSRRFSNSVNLSIILHGNNHTSSQFPHVDVLESPTMSGFNEFSACHQFGMTQSFTTFNTTQTIGRTIQKTANFTVNQCHPSDNANAQNGQTNDWKMWSPLISGGRGIFPLSLDGTRGDALPIITADWRSQA